MGDCMSAPSGMLPDPQCYECVFCIPIGPHELRVTCGNEQAVTVAHNCVQGNRFFDWPKAFDPVYIIGCNGFTKSALELDKPP